MSYKLEEIFEEIPFVPAYDPVLPIEQKEEDRGVLCILLNPCCNVCTVRVERHMGDIMEKLSFVTRYSHLVKFYQLGNKMIIENNEGRLDDYSGVLIYNGQPMDLKGNTLICNKGFVSLTQAEALKILESAKLERDNLGTCKIVIKIEE